MIYIVYLVLLICQWFCQWKQMNLSYIALWNTFLLNFKMLSGCSIYFSCLHILWLLTMYMYLVPPCFSSECLFSFKGPAMLVKLLNDLWIIIFVIIIFHMALAITTSSQYPHICKMYMGLVYKSILCIPLIFSANFTLIFKFY